MKNTLKFTISGGKLLSAFMVGALSTVMATMAMAAPGAQPTLGDVNANFSSVATSTITHTNGSCGSWGCDVNLGIRFATPVIAQFGILATDAYISGNISNENSTNGGKVTVNDDLNVKGSVSINKDLVINGDIVAATDTGGNPLPLNISAALRNPATVSGNSLPVRVEDDFLVAGQITNTGNIATAGSLSVGLNITSSGGQIGSYQKRYKVLPVLNSAVGIKNLNVTCPDGTKIVSCTGRISNAFGNGTYNGSEIIISSNSCQSTSYKQTAGTTGHILYSEAICFDPSGTLTGEELAN